MGGECDKASVPSLPRPRADLHEARIGEEFLVYDPVLDRTHRFNRAAALIWQLVDGESSLGELESDLAEALGQPLADVVGDIARAVESFSAAGLLDQGSPVVRASSTSAPAADSCAPPPGREITVLGPYRALERTVEILVHDAPHVADEIGRLLTPLAIVPHAAAGTTESFTVWHDRCWHLQALGQHIESSDESVLIDFVMFQVNWLATREAQPNFLLHAAVVARDGEAIVLPAMANSGKSTLAAALVRAGFDYLSDEAAVIDLDSGAVHAYSKPITLDPGSQALFPELDPGRLPGRSTKWYVDPDAVRPGCMVAQAKLTHLVFPTHVPGADNRLVEIGVADAAEMLIGHAFNLVDHGHRLADIVALVEGATCHTLEHDGIDGPVDAISSLL